MFESKQWRPFKSRVHVVTKTSSLYRLFELGLVCTHAVDVGAHKGGWTKELLQIYPNCHVILVEPQSRFEELLTLKRTNPKVHLFQNGAGPNNQDLPFRHHKRDDSSSFSLNPMLNYQSEEMLRVRSVDSMAVEAWGQGVFPEVLKIDAEGYDLQVVEGAEGILSQTQVVIIEAGLTNQYFENNLLEVIKKFDDLGFDVIDIATAVTNPNTGFAWNCDVTFVNRNFTKNLTLSLWDFE